MLRTSFLLQKIKKGSNSINTGDRVMVFAFCNSPHGPQSVLQVSLNYFQSFRDMLWTSFYCKKKRSNSINTGDSYGSCSLQFPSQASISVSTLIKLPSILLEIYSGQKCDRQTDGCSYERYVMRLSL